MKALGSTGIFHDIAVSSLERLQTKTKKNTIGSGGIRTHASEETGALNQRLRPLGHATLLALTLQMAHRPPYCCPLY